MTTSTTPRAERLRTLIVACAGLALGLLYLLDIRDSIFFDVPMVDAADYYNQAREIAAGHSPSPGRAFYKPPLYPYFLGGLLGLFGRGVWAPLLVQALMGGLSGALLYRISRRYLAPAWALLTSGLFLLYAPLAFFQGQLLIVSLYLLLSLSCLLLVIRAGTDVPAHGEDPPSEKVLAAEEPGEDPVETFPRRGGLVRIRESRLLPALGAGLLWGLALLARPSALLWGVPLGLWLLWPRRGKRFFAGIGRAAAFSVAAFLVVLPVTLRNHRAEGVWVPISYNGGINFYIGNNPRFEETLAIRPGLEWEELEALPKQGGPIANSAEFSRAYYRESFSFFREEPASFLENWGKKLLQAFSGYRIDRNLDFKSYARDSLWLRFSPIRFATIGPLAICGLLLAWRRRHRPTPIGLYFLGVLAGLVAFFVTERYRVAALPALAFFAAVGLEDLLRSLRAKRLPALLWPGALLFGSILLVVGDPGGVRRLDYARPDYDRAQALARKGRLHEAKEAYRRACARDPRSPDVHFRLAETLERLGEVDEALAEYDLAARAVPGSHKPHRNRASLFAHAGKYEQAERSLDRVLDLVPGDRKARRDRAALRSYRGEWKGALLDFEIALGAPQDLKEPLGLSATKTAFGQFLERNLSAQISEDRLRQLLTYGELLSGAGEHGRAITLFDRAWTLTRNAPPVLQADLQVRRAEVLLRLKQDRQAGKALEEAERLYRKARAAPPLQYLLARAKALSVTGDPEGAISWIEDALEIDPQSARAHYAHACARALSGEPEGALESLARAVEFGFRDRDRAEGDPDIVSLRELPRFHELLEEMDGESSVRGDSE
jgi:tetratricopeptide (TPR) repeat protein